MTAVLRLLRLSLLVWNRSSSIDLILFVNISRKECFEKLKYSVFLLVNPLSLLARDTHCQNLAMAKTLKMQFPVKPSVEKRNG